MQIWIALLRGVNVGGNTKLPMAELTATLEKMGIAEVKTYIQSGNVVFLGPKASPLALAKKLSGS